MQRNCYIFPLALLMAIAIHVLVLQVAEQYYIRYRLTLSDEVRRLVAVQPEQTLLIHFQPPPELDLGQAEHLGDAVNELDRPDPFSARQSEQIQAPLSRDPGAPADPEAPPEIIPPIPPADQPPAPPPPPTLSREITHDHADQHVLPAQSGDTPQPAPLLPLAALLAEAAQAANPPTAEPAESQSTPAPPDPFPQADADSDPFHTTGSVTFHAGRVEAQFGRAIKPVRPRIRLAGMWDGLALQYPSVTLRIRTDEHGQVRAAEITKSSGSLNIDQPVLVAIYEWWFEPPTDPNGNPRPDTFTFTLHFR